MKRHSPTSSGVATGQAAVAVLLLGMLAFSGRALAGSLAVFRLDPLAVDPGLVNRLEGLLRIEVNRLANITTPGKQKILRMLARHPHLDACTGDVGCLSDVGQRLGVERVISGNVAALGDSYVINLKVVDVATQRESGRVQETISGRPDQLIEAVRVAAYGLIAPERLRGALTVLATVPGADVYLDGTLVGQTPLPVQHGLAVGTHTLRISRSGYTDVVQPIQVPFQKTAEVVIKMKSATADAPGTALGRADRPVAWYTRWWFWTAVGTAAVGLGVVLGYAFSSATGINCDADPAKCGI